MSDKGKQKIEKGGYNPPPKAESRPTKPTPQPPKKK